MGAVRDWGTSSLIPVLAAACYRAPDWLHSVVFAVAFAFVFTVATHYALRASQADQQHLLDLLNSRFHELLQSFELRRHARQQLGEGTCLFIGFDCASESD